jgi:hypothetical protein
MVVARPIEKIPIAKAGSIAKTARIDRLTNVAIENHKRSSPSLSLWLASSNFGKRTVDIKMFVAFSAATVRALNVSL